MKNNNQLNIYSNLEIEQFNKFFEISKSCYMT